MKELDPGHNYKLECYDGSEPLFLRFVKRNDPPEKYPGNTSAYPGTNIQEVLRALIARVKYIDKQDHSIFNDNVLYELRNALVQLELRAHQRHGFMLPLLKQPIEEIETCKKCGHILCKWCT